MNSREPRQFWPEADVATARGTVGWPKVFCVANSDLDSVQAQKRLARRELLTRDDLFITRGHAVGLDTASAPGKLLSALRECGDATCSCCRLSCPRARRAFCQHVVESVLAARGDHEPIRYVSLGCGDALTDAQILSGLLEGGGILESVTLVDSRYGDHFPEHAAALSQLASFFAPCECVAFHSLRLLLERADPNLAVTPSVPHAAGAHVIIACDAGEAVSKGIRQTASTLLAEGGLAFVLMNGGKYGSTTRAWARTAASARGPSGDHGAAGAAGGRGGSRQNHDARLGLVELAVPREPDAGPPFPPHMQW